MKQRTWLRHFVRCQETHLISGFLVLWKRMDQTTKQGLQLNTFSLTQKGTNQMGSSFCRRGLTTKWRTLVKFALSDAKIHKTNGVLVFVPFVVSGGGGELLN